LIADDNGEEAGAGLVSCCLILSMSSRNC
jgi:hypothetical protein